MAALEIFKECIGDVSIGVAILLTLIQLAPIKINPWSKIFYWIGRLFNKSLYDELETIKKDLETVKKETASVKADLEKHDAEASRVRIIRFGDEVSHGIKHSRGHYHQIFDDITVYKEYCKKTQDFEDNMTKLDIKRIEDDYLERDKTGDFLE